MSASGVPSRLAPELNRPAAYRALPSEDREAQLFWWLRLRIARATLTLLFTNARLRSVLVVALSAVFWLGLFGLFFAAFQFIVQQVGRPGSPYHAQTSKLLFHLFFASLNVMLVFSSGVILYSTIFRSPDARLLMTLPTRPERIVLHKFQEAALLSSWGFFLLASPMMLAYGIVLHAPWWYYAMIVPMILAFVYIPCALGAVACLLLVAKLPKLKLAVVASMAVATIFIAARSIWRTVSGPQSEMFGSEWFQATVKRFQFTQQEWLPSSWLSNGLLEAARPWGDGPSSGGLELPIVQSCLYLTLLISNALMLHLVVVWSGKRWLRTGFNCLSERGSRRTSSARNIVDQLADWVLRPFPDQIRLLLVKDWQLLRRDPVQWSQFLIFFGLLGLYFLNIDRFSNPINDISYVAWVNLVSFLNLAVVGLILSTFTTRFIYPMISLEGQRFWVLGLLPIERDTILWSKFVFASLGSWIPCALLILVSDLMLQVDILVVLVHQYTCLLLCLGLASIAVGLGAMMPDFRETSPSKIAAGFGGTLNLVLSALYIIVTVVLTALPCHFYLIADLSPIQSAWLRSDRVGYLLIGGMVTATALGAAATIIPLRRGLRSFAAVELA